MDETKEDLKEKNDSQETETSHMEERRKARQTTELWTIGVILVIIGAVTLARNAGGFYLENWWALLILIPAFGAFTRAWETYKNHDNQWTKSARGSLIGGVVFIVIAVFFLFNLNWIIFGPILLILGGGLILLNSLAK